METLRDPGDIQAQQCTTCDGASATCWCLDCGEALCDDCLAAHRRVTLTRSHRVLNRQPEGSTFISPTKFCRTHMSEELQLFCFTCCRLTCRDCQLADHKNHRFDFVHKAVGSVKRNLDACVQPVRARIEASTQSLQDMETRLQLLDQYESFMTTKLEKHVNTLTELLKRRFEEISQQIQVVYNLERKLITRKMEKVKQLQKSHIPLTEAVEKARSTTDLPTLVGCISQITAQLKELEDTDLGPPSKKINVNVITDRSSVQGILNFGKLYISWIPFYAASSSSSLAVAPPASSSPASSDSGPPPPSTLTSLGSMASSSDETSLQAGPGTDASPPIGLTGSSSYCPPPPSSSSSSGETILPLRSSDLPPTSISKSSSDSIGNLGSGVASVPAAFAKSRTAQEIEARNPHLCHLLNHQTSPLSAQPGLAHGRLPLSSSSVTPGSDGVRQATTIKGRGSSEDKPDSGGSAGAKPAQTRGGPALSACESSPKGSDSTVRINILTKSQLEQGSGKVFIKCQWRNNGASGGSSGVGSATIQTRRNSQTVVEPPLPPPAALLPLVLVPVPSPPGATVCPIQPPLILNQPETAKKTSLGVCSEPRSPVQPSPTATHCLLLLKDLTLRVRQLSSSRRRQQCNPGAAGSSRSGSKDEPSQETAKTPESGQAGAMRPTAVESTPADSDQPLIVVSSEEDEPEPPRSRSAEIQSSATAVDPPIVLSEEDEALSEVNQVQPRCKDVPSFLRSISPAASGEDHNIDDDEPEGSNVFGEPASPGTSEDKMSVALSDEPELGLKLSPSETSDSEDEDTPSFKTEAQDYGRPDWQPTVSLLRLPLSLPGPGRPPPRYYFIPGSAPSELHLQVVEQDDAQSSDGDVSETVTDHASDVTEDFTEVPSPDTPLSLEVISCAACGSSSASKICTVCGRGYHRDCHVPPFGPDIWSELVCSLCQDLSDPSDPFSADRPGTSARPRLSLLDQRRCENLLLHLKVKGCRRLSQLDRWSDLMLASERLSLHRPTPYHTAAQVVSDLWDLFRNAPQGNALMELQRIFQKKLVETFGSELPPSLLTAPADRPGGGSATSELKLKVLKKRLRDFLELKGSSAPKKPKMTKADEQQRADPDH